MKAAHASKNVNFYRLIYGYCLFVFASRACTVSRTMQKAVCAFRQCPSKMRALRQAVHRSTDAVHIQVIDGDAQDLRAFFSYSRTQSEGKKKPCDKHLQRARHRFVACPRAS
jgi:hypothetical protein